MHEQVSKLARPLAHVDSDQLVKKLVLRFPGAMECRVASLEQQPLLGVHCWCLRDWDPKGLVTEQLRIKQERPVAHTACHLGWQAAHLLWGLLEIPSIGWDLTQQVTAAIACLSECSKAGYSMG
jgi:hypothetical protein